MSETIREGDIVKIDIKQFKELERAGLIFKNAHASGKVTCVGPFGITVAIETYLMGKFYPVTFNPGQVEKVNL